VAGIAVLNVGHSNPEVSGAVTTQMEKMAHCAFTDFFADPPGSFLFLKNLSFKKF